MAELANDMAKAEVRVRAVRLAERQVSHDTVTLERTLPRVKEQFCDVDGRAKPFYNC